MIKAPQSDEGRSLSRQRIKRAPFSRRPIFIYPVSRSKQVPYKSAAKRTPANPRAKTVCPALKAAEAPDLFVAVAELPLVVPLAPAPPEVAVPVELPLDAPLDMLPVAEEVALALTMAVPLGPATAVKVELAAELAPVATMTRVVLLLVVPPAPMPLMLDMLLVMLLVALMLEPLPTGTTGAGMPGEPDMKEAGAACDVAADARDVMTDGWEVMTDGMPVMTPRESVMVVKEVKGLSCDY